MLFRLLQMARYTGLPRILQEIEIIGKTVGKFWELWKVAFSWSFSHRELEYGTACHKSFWCPKDTRALVRRSSGHCLRLVYLFPLQWAHYYCDSATISIHFPSFLMNCSSTSCLLWPHCFWFQGSKKESLFESVGNCLVLSICLGFSSQTRHPMSSLWTRHQPLAKAVMKS